MDPLVAAALPVAGTIGGIAFGWWLSRRSEQERWARDDRLWVRTEKLKAYVAFLVAADKALSGHTGHQMALAFGREPEGVEGSDTSESLQTISLVSPTV